MSSSSPDLFFCWCFFRYTEVDGCGSADATMFSQKTKGEETPLDPKKTIPISKITLTCLPNTNIKHYWKDNLKPIHEGPGCTFRRHKCRLWGFQWSKVIPRPSQKSHSKKYISTHLFHIFLYWFNLVCAIACPLGLGNLIGIWFWLEILEEEACMLWCACKACFELQKKYLAYFNWLV